MGAKRNSNRRKILRPGIYRWSGSVAVVAVLISGWYLAVQYSDEAVPIERVEIAGTFAHLSKVDIRNQVAPTLDRGYFTLDLDRVREALLVLPWIEDVSVRRQWPSVLKIEVKERQAIAYWNDDALLSSEGKLFRPENIDKKMDLPVLRGPEGLHHKVWSFLVALHKQLLAIDLSVETLFLDERRSWSMFLTNGVELHLGRIDIDKRMNRFIDVFSMSNAPDINMASYIDLRYTNGFAMQVKETQSEDETVTGMNKKVSEIHA